MCVHFCVCGVYACTWTFFSFVDEEIQNFDNVYYEKYACVFEFPIVITGVSSVLFLTEHQVILEMQMAIHLFSRRHLTYNQNEAEC